MTKYKHICWWSTGILTGHVTGSSTTRAADRKLSGLTRCDGRPEMLSFISAIYSNVDFSTLPTTLLPHFSLFCINVLPRGDEDLCWNAIFLIFLCKLKHKPDKLAGIWNVLHCTKYSNGELKLDGFMTNRPLTTEL